MRREKLKKKIKKQEKIIPSTKEKGSIKATLLFHEVQKIHRMHSDIDEKKDFSQLSLVLEKLVIFFNSLLKYSTEENWDFIIKSVNSSWRKEIKSADSFQRECGKLNILQFRILIGWYEPRKFSIHELTLWIDKFFLPIKKIFPNCYDQKEVFLIGDALHTLILKFPESFNAKLVEKFSEFGHLDSMLLLCKHYGDRGDLLKAFEWAEKSVALNNSNESVLINIAETSRGCSIYFRQNNPEKSKSFLEKAILYHERLVDRLPPNPISCQKLIDIYLNDMKSDPLARPKLIKYCRKSEKKEHQLLLAELLYGDKRAETHFVEIRQILGALMSPDYNQALIVAMCCERCYSSEELFVIADLYLQNPENIKLLKARNTLIPVLKKTYRILVNLSSENPGKDKQKLYFEKIKFYKQLMNATDLFNDLMYSSDLGSALKSFDSLLKSRNHEYSWKEIEEKISRSGSAAPSIGATILELCELTSTLSSLRCYREFSEFITRPGYYEFLNRIMYNLSKSNSLTVLNLFSQLSVSSDELQESKLISRIIKFLPKEAINDEILMIYYRFISDVGLPENYQDISTVLEMFNYFLRQNDVPLKNLCLILYALNFLHLRHQNFSDLILNYTVNVLNKIDHSQRLMNYYDVEQLKTSCVYFLLVVKNSKNSILISQINKICRRIFHDIALKVEDDENLKSKINANPSNAQLRMHAELTRYFVNVEQEVLLTSTVKGKNFIRSVDFSIDGKAKVEYDGAYVHHLFRRDGKITPRPKVELRNFLIKHKFKVKNFIQLSERSADFPGSKLKWESLAWSRQCFIFLSAAFKSYCNLPIINFYVNLTWVQQHQELWRKDWSIGGYLEHYDLWHRPKVIQELFNKSSNEFYQQLAQKDGLLPDGPELRSIRYVPDCGGV
jgi:hypothetical protein